MSSKFFKFLDYEPKDIWNADETGLFWRLKPNKSMRFKGETCSGGKLSKERITILLCANIWTALKEKKVDIIGKSADPQSFGKRKRNLQIDCYSNRKAWMTSELRKEIMTKLNKKTTKENRRI